jgi:ABC-type uncharacterized transport system substrate-binding protein
MMNRRRVLQGMSASLLAAPVAAKAQPAGKVYRIGVLISASALWAQPLLEAFRQELRDLGYVQGQNLVIEQRSAEGHNERLPGLMAELIQLKVEVIVAGGPSAASAAQQATSTIPIVMSTSDPVEQGLIAGFADTRRNITGVSILSVELLGKQLELLKEAVPLLVRVAVLANPSMPGLSFRIHSLTETARVLGLHLHVMKVSRPDELDQAFAAMIRAGAKAFLVVPEPTVIEGLHSRIVVFAARHRLPAMYYWKFNVEAGGLMSYGPSLSGMYRRFAYFVDRLLKGAKPADLPMETPLRYEFVVNLKVAKALGLTIPQSVRLRADQIIE